MDTQLIILLGADDTVGGITGGTAIRPQRERTRTQESWEEQIRPARKQERKKPNSQRRAPARGRYIDEYARPVA
jgi:hypothetical protein